MAGKINLLHNRFNNQNFQKTDSPRIVQKHLGTILSYQLFFSILFGALVFKAIYSVGTKLSVIVAQILAIPDFNGHKLAPIILATIFYTLTVFLTTFTVAQHYGIRKKQQTVVIGSIATSTLAVMLLVVIGVNFIIPILVATLLIAVFGSHSFAKVHESLTIPSKPVKAHGKQRKKQVSRKKISKNNG